MKANYKTASIQDFVIEIAISRSCLSIYSGGTESPHEFSVEYRGLSQDAGTMRFAIKSHLPFSPLESLKH